MLISSKVASGDESSLLREVGSGSREALAVVYSRYARTVYWTAFRILGSEPDAEDVLQDVFVGLPEALKSYREAGRFEAWLRRVTARYSLMKLRAGGRRREVPLDELQSGPGTDPDEPTDRLTLERALLRMPEPLRVVFTMKEIDGMSHAEIAELLGITPGASAARLFRAWKILRKEARSE